MHYSFQSNQSAHHTQLLYHIYIIYHLILRFLHRLCYLLDQIKALKGIKTLGDLRLAVVTKAEGLKIPAKLLEKDLGRALAACISG